MSNPNAIWVVVANENSAAICTSSDGSSSLLREVKPALTDMPMSPGNAKRAFAWELMSELCRGAENKAYEGVILVANSDMLAELRRVVMPAVRDFLIAEIVGTPDWSIAV